MGSSLPKTISSSPGMGTLPVCPSATPPPQGTWFGLRLGLGLGLGRGGPLSLLLCNDDGSPDRRRCHCDASLDRTQRTVHATPAFPHGGKQQQLTTAPEIIGPQRDWKRSCKCHPRLEKVGGGAFLFVHFFHFRCNPRTLFSFSM